jgi:FkbM family methyltransferase
MPGAYASWLAHRALGRRGPILRLGDQAAIGASWFSFSEYWSFRCGEFASGPTNLIQRNVNLFLKDCAAATKGGVAVDAGANIGIFAVELAALGYDVHAFEPIPDTYTRLLANVALNPVLTGRIHAVECAFGQRKELLAMTLPVNSPATAHVAQGPDKGTAMLLEVQVTTLDGYAADCEIHHIDFLKLDVEGYEPAVLRGAAGLLKRQAIGTILFEWCPPLLRRAGFDPRELLDELHAAGYGVFEIAEAGEVVKARSAEALLNACEWDNLVAMPQRRRSQG